MTNPPTNSASNAKPCRAVLSTLPKPLTSACLSLRNSAPVCTRKPGGTSGSTASTSSVSLPVPRRYRSSYSCCPEFSQSNAVAAGIDTVPPESCASALPNDVMPTMVVSN